MVLCLLHLLLSAAAPVLALDDASTLASSEGYRRPIWILVGGTFLVWLVYHSYLYPFHLSPLRDVPEPNKKDARFPWGHVHRIFKEYNGETFRVWINTVPHNGLIKYRAFLNKEYLVLTSPDTLRDVLVTKYDDWEKPFEPTWLLRTLVGNGLLVVDGDVHTRQRKGLMPVFSYRHVKDLYSVFWTKARESADAIALEANKSKKPIKIYHWAGRVTLDVISQAGMGYDFNAVGDPNSEIVTTYRTLFDNEPPLFFWLNVGIWLPVRQAFSLPVPAFLQAKACAARIKNICYEAIRRKRAVLEKGGDAAANLDILSVALTSGVFTDDNLADQLMTFLAAGHETTASALAWMMYILAKHPAVQTRLRAEIRANLPSLSDESQTATAAQVDRLPYLNAVINETLRFIPPVPGTSRDARRTTTLAGYTIPKGTRVFIVPWGVNTSYELWGPDAETFNPERWLKEGQANVGGAESNYSFLTFLHGQRSCIGRDFAKGELMCLLAGWIGRFEVKLADEALPLTVDGYVTARPPHGVPLVMKEVEGW